MEVQAHCNPSRLTNLDQVLRHEMLYIIVLYTSQNYQLILGHCRFVTCWWSKNENLLNPFRHTEQLANHVSPLYTTLYLNSKLLYHSSYPHISMRRRTGTALKAYSSQLCLMITSGGQEVVTSLQWAAATARWWHRPSSSHTTSMTNKLFLHNCSLFCL